MFRILGLKTELRCLAKLIEGEPWNNGKSFLRLTYRSQVQAVQKANNACIRVCCLYHTPRGAALPQTLRECAGLPFAPLSMLITSSKLVGGWSVSNMHKS